ncbi:extracellular solute-binding protein [Patescibacteria group bacterium]|nr:extracellular solute-binding protein [Patescibacteria group bacterium]
MRMRRIFGAVLLGATLVMVGAGCSGDSASTANTTKPVTLTYWRVFDDEDAFTEIISSYRVLHPNVKIEYRKLRAEEYEEELLKALAKGEGPDIFSVHNSRVAEFQDLLQPMPASVQISTLEVQGSLRKETVYVPKTVTLYTQKQLEQQFVDVVAEDAVLPYQPDEDTPATDRIYGLPLSVDTMALYYNQDLLNAAGIAEPPTTWDAFQEAVIKLTKIDANGQVTQSGAALGTSENVERSSDILALLMMQNGTQMTDDRGRVAFQTIPVGTERGVFPALDATRFYTDFANPAKETYTWNDSFPNSFDAFTRGQTAFFLGYSYHAPLITAANPKLRFEVSAAPQISGGRQVNYANYWIEGVSKNTDASNYAWDFLAYAAKAENVASYLEEAQKPTALRSVINAQLEDDFLGVFASQILLADSWYHGKDALAAEQAFYDLIDAILNGSAEPEDEVESAARIISQTY